LRELLAEWYRKSFQIAPVRIRKLSRWRLAEIYGEHSLVKGAEIGVDRGKFSAHMLAVIPGLELLCVDPWHWKQRGEARLQSTMERLEPYDTATIIRKTSLDASLEVPDQSLDFVYIDGDHRFDHVMLDLILWAQKVRYGGIISGHDYYRWRHGGVVPAVDAYTQQHGVARWFVTDERTPSFFWVREPHFADT